LSDVAALPVPRHLPAGQVKAPEITVLATTAAVGAALTVYVPVPPVPEPSAVMVVPGGTLLPDMTMPTTIAPEVIDDTVSVVELRGMAPRKTGAVAAEMDVLAETATVGGVLTEHVHGTVALVHEPPTMEVTVVPAGTLVPDSVMPTSSVPDATADTVSVVVLIGMAPVMAALGSAGLTPSPAGQK